MFWGPGGLSGIFTSCITDWIITSPCSAHLYSSFETFYFSGGRLPYHKFESDQCEGDCGKGLQVMVYLLGMSICRIFAVWMAFIPGVVYAFINMSFMSQTKTNATYLSISKYRCDWKFKAFFSWPSILGADDKMTFTCETRSTVQEILANVLNTFLDPVQIEQFNGRLPVDNYGLKVRFIIFVRCSLQILGESKSD